MNGDGPSLVISQHLNIGYRERSKTYAILTINTSPYACIDLHVTGTDSFLHSKDIIESLNQYFKK